MTEYEFLSNLVIEDFTSYWLQVRDLVQALALWCGVLHP